MQGIFQKENTDKALKYGIYRHLPTYEKIIRNLVSFYTIELYDFLVTGDIVDQLEYTSEGLHDANHNLDKFYVALKIAEMINKG